MSDTEQIKERLEEVLTQKETREELVKRLGVGFTQLIKNIETAESDLTNYIDAQKPDDETQMLVLQFLTSHFALKAGASGAGVVIGHAAPPTLVFSIIQNRVLAGFHSRTIKHREICPVPDCRAAAPLTEFLSAMAELMAKFEKLEAASLARHMPHDGNGNPTVN